MNARPPIPCLICGETIADPAASSVCPKCRERFGPAAGLSENEESSRLLAALLQIERRQHAETRRKLAKAEHDRDRYHKSLIGLMDGIHGIISKASRLCRPPCDGERQVRT